MDLMTECTTCGGNGETTSPDGVTACRRCDGRGRVPTPKGSEMLEFLNTFADVIFHGWEIGDLAGDEKKPEDRIRGLTRRIDRQE